MTYNQTKLYRKWGYDILINNFEQEFRLFLANEVFLLNFGKSWKEHVPKSMFGPEDLDRISELRDDVSIEEYFDELTLIHLKNIVLNGSFFSYSKEFIGQNIEKEKFDLTMNDLNILRRKIAHAKLSFTYENLQSLIEKILIVSQGPASKEIVTYIELEKYKSAGDIPQTFYEEYSVPNNLPFEDFDIDGGFVGREKEIRDIKKLIYSNEDRILTIIGAGGVGKTAIALKLAHETILAADNPFTAIMWFSAKESKLTDSGILPLETGIRSEMQFAKEISCIIDAKQEEALDTAKVDFNAYRNFIYNAFKKNRVLLVVDNLETVYKNQAIIEFIKNIPRPSQVLVTSRKGLGEIERRYQLNNMNDKDAIKLFKTISKEKNRLDLVSMNEDAIRQLCRKVKNYPLLIKWSIGQVCMGKDIDKAFSVILEGSSDIASFVFNDVFLLLSSTSKIVLYSMIVYENKPMKMAILANISKLDDDELNDAIKELNLSSLIISEVVEDSGSPETVYYMLDLTMGFVETKLQSEEKLLMQLQNNKYHLIDQIKGEELAKSGYAQSLISFGVKTESDRIAFLNVKSAKNYQLKGEFKEAENYFKEAIKASPHFAYALTEYAKFEFYRGFHHQALDKMKQAIEFDQENFLVFFSYGKMLSIARRHEEAVMILQKAKELNPQYLPIYNELGRVYSITGEYDKAEIEFRQALTEQKYPNIRHKVMTLQFLGENFRRKSQACRDRKDVTGEIQNLNRGLETVLDGMQLSPSDLKLSKLRAAILIDLGIAYSKSGNLKEGNEYFEMAMKPLIIGNITLQPSEKTMCEATYYSVAFYGKAGQISKSSIKGLIRRGYTYCQTNSKFLNKFKNLEKELLEVDETIKNDLELLGLIKYYKQERKFGVIEASGKGFIFFPNSFSEYINQNDIQNLVGKSVSFIPIQQNEKQVASMIRLLN